MAPSPTRRAVISASLALAACGRAEGAPQVGPIAALKQVAPFPVGASITADQLSDPAATSLLTREFGQITPGLEMKMETVLRDDGGFDFAKAVVGGHPHRLEGAGHVFGGAAQRLR